MLTAVARALYGGGWSEVIFEAVGRRDQLQKSSGPRSI